MNKEYLTYENKILGQEVERLAKEVERLEKVNKMLLNSMVTEAHTKETEEIERLNNIINGLEKDLQSNMAYYDNLYEELDEQEYIDKYFALKEVFNKLQELKHKKIYGSVDSEILYYDELGVIKSE